MKSSTRILYWQLCKEADEAWLDYVKLNTHVAFERYQKAKQTENIIAQKLRKENDDGTVSP